MVEAIQQVNGQYVKALESEIPITEGYKPSLPCNEFFGADGVPVFNAMRDIEIMRTHPHCGLSMEYYKAGLYGAEFEVEAESSEIGEFVANQVEQFWDRGLPKLQQGYDYGWIGCECMYDDSDGVLKWDHFDDFAPRDAFCLTRENRYVGIRVKNIVGRGTVDLWSEKSNIPSKAYWYAHQPRFGNRYGMTHYLNAWRPFRRLATMNGAEFVLDAAVYRYGIGGPIYRFPPNAYVNANNAAGPQISGRDMARQFVEQVAAGAGAALPNTRDKDGNYLWALEWRDTKTNVAEILSYVKYLCDEISYGIKVPPELIEANETGSGYSGRAIPWEAFLLGQQHLGDAFLQGFVKQVLEPLVCFNYGPQKFTVKLKSLLKVRQAMGQQQQQKPGQQGMGGQQQPGQQEMPPPNVGQMPGGQPQLSIADLSRKIITLAKLPAPERRDVAARGHKLVDFIWRRVA